MSTIPDKLSAELYQDLKKAGKKGAKAIGKRISKETTLAAMAAGHSVFPDAQDKDDIYNWRGTEVVLQAYLNSSHENQGGRSYILLGEPSSGKSSCGKALTNRQWSGLPDLSLTYNLDMTDDLDIAYNFMVQKSLYPVKKGKEVESVLLAEHILAALKPQPKPVDRPNITKKAVSSISDSMSELDLCGKKGGTLSYDEALPRKDSGETATTEGTEGSSTSSKQFLPLLGRSEELAFLKRDKRPVLFINDVNCDLKVDSKLWQLFIVLVSRAQTQGITIFFTTNDKKIANQLYSINGGSKIVPLPCLVDKYCAPAVWESAHTKDEIDDVIAHSKSNKLPNFLWKQRPFVFTEDEQFELLVQLFPSLDHASIRHEIHSSAEFQGGLGGIIDKLREIEDDRMAQETMQQPEV